MKKGPILTIILAFLLFLVNVNAQLLEVNLSARAIDNDVVLSWTYSFHGTSAYGTECIRVGDSCCINDVCEPMTVSCMSGYGAIFNGCNKQCKPLSECEPLRNLEESRTSYGTGFSVRNILRETNNVITGNSVSDAFADVFSNLNNFIKNLFKPRSVGLGLSDKTEQGEYKFKIYRNNILINENIRSAYCDGNICEYEDKDLNAGEYSYYVKILSTDEEESKNSNTVNVEIEPEIIEQVDAYLTLATTKNDYTNYERIELTDPPENAGGNLLGSGIAREFVSPPDGYIVQFKQEPVLVRKARLENELQDLREKSISYKENYEEASKSLNALNFIYNYPKRDINKVLYSNAQKKYAELQESFDDKIENYENEFNREFKNSLEEVKEELRLDESRIKREFNGDLFNGVVLDIDEEQAKEIEKLDNVENVFPNEIVYAALDKSVPVINADIIVKEFGLTGENVTVAVIDTGIDPRHESLDDLDDNPNTDDPKIIGFNDFVNFKQDSYDDHFHGTHVAGICCGTGGINHTYVGVAPKAKLVGVKVLGDHGSGTYDQVIAGMEWVAQNKDRYNIRVASMSLGGRARPDNDPMEYAANALVDYGITLVVAAGNSGPSSRTIASPGTAEKAITVGAINNNLEIASFSSRGPTSDGRIKPDIAAPGISINAPKLDTIDEYWKLSGTSMATPHVSGAIALLYQYRPDFNASIISLNDPAHEIYVYDILLNDKFAQLNDNVNVNALIKNSGLNDEINLNAGLYVNCLLRDSSVIASLNSGEIEEVSFSYLADESGDNEIKIKIQPIEGELFKSNNEAVRKIKIFESIKGEINAVVVDSWGTDFSRYTIFDELNEQWFNYGEYLVEIDYNLLNKESITYEDLAESEADVLIISNAWDDGSYTGNNWHYTDEEIDAIKQYVNEGHGIIATSGTFSELVPNNMKLAPLFGMDQSKIGNWADYWSGYMDILYKDNLIFNNIEEDSYYTPAYYNNNGLELNDSQDGLLLALSTDDKAKILYHDENANNIYLTSIEEINEVGGPDSSNRLIFYNAIVMASLNVSKSDYDLRLFDLRYDNLVYAGENASVIAKIKSIGSDESNVVVDLLLNNLTQDSILIPYLQRNEMKEIEFIYNPMIGENNLKLHAHELPLETEKFDNYMTFTSNAPKAVIKSLSDYGTDTNNDGKINYLVLNVTLDVMEDGYYYVSASSLRSIFGVEIENAVSSKSVFMKKGIDGISLLFDGTEVRKWALNGPYKIRDIYARGEDLSEDYYPEYTTKPYLYDEFQLSSDLKVEISSGNYKEVINKSFNIDFEITNDGIAPAYDSILDVYSIYSDSNNQEINDNVFHEDLLVIIPKETISGEFDFTPTSLGYHQIIFSVNSSNDFKQENNADYAYYNIVPDGPDLIGFIMEVNGVLGIENNVAAFIQNIGIEEITQSKASLYLVEDNNLIFIQEIDTGSLTVDEEKDIGFVWTPNKTGMNQLRLVVESPEDLNLNNNVNDAFIYVIVNAPDIISRISILNQPWIINQSNEIELNVNNIGPKDAHNVTASFYLEKNNERTLILSEFYPVITSKAYKFIRITRSFDEAGDYGFLFEVRSEDVDEIEDNNNYYSYLRVIPDEADATINDIQYEYRNFLTNEDINLTIKVYNQGSKTANNVNLYTYHDDEILHTEFIGDISKNQLKEVKFSIRLDEGGNYLTHVVNSSNDGNLDNNIYSSYFNIVPKSLIMNLEDISINGYLLINIEKYYSDNNTWSVYQNVLNDLDNDNLRVIEPNSYLALDKIFNQFDVKINEEGIYRVYVALLNRNGNIIPTRSGDRLEGYYRFYVFHLGEI